MWTFVLLSNSRLKTINSAGSVGGTQINGSWMQEVNFQKLSSMSKVMRLSAKKVYLLPLHLPERWRSWTQGSCHQDLHHRCAQTETRLDPWLCSNVVHPFALCGAAGGPCCQHPALHPMLLVWDTPAPRSPLVPSLSTCLGQTPSCSLPTVWW